MLSCDKLNKQGLGTAKMRKKQLQWNLSEAAILGTRFCGSLTEVKIQEIVWGLDQNRWHLSGGGR